MSIRWALAGPVTHLSVPPVFAPKTLLLLMASHAGCRHSSTKPADTFGL